MYLTDRHTNLASNFGPRPPSDPHANAPPDLSSAILFIWDTSCQNSNTKHVTAEFGSKIDGIVSLSWMSLEWEITACLLAVHQAHASPFLHVLRGKIQTFLLNEWISPCYSYKLDITWIINTIKLYLQDDILYFWRLPDLDGENLTCYGYIWNPFLALNTFGDHCI